MAIIQENPDKRGIPYPRDVMHANATEEGVHFVLSLFTDKIMKNLVNVIVI